MDFNVYQAFFVQGSKLKRLSFADCTGVKRSGRFDPEFIAMTGLPAEQE